MRRMDWKHIPWGTADIILYFVLLILALAGLMLFTNLLSILGVFNYLPSIFIIVTAALLQALAMVGLVFLICFVKNKGTWLDLGIYTANRRAIIPGILGGLALLLISMAYGFFVVNLAGEVPSQGIVEQIGDYRSPAGLISLGFVVVVIAPLSEELVFRGFVYGAVRRKGGFAVAGLISSLAFTIIHLQFHIVLFTQIFILGFVLAWIYERSKNLAAPILAHAVYNLAITMIIFSTR